jgi:hypothetical protein
MYRPFNGGGAVTADPPEAPAYTAPPDYGEPKAPTPTPAPTPAPAAPDTTASASAQGVLPQNRIQQSQGGVLPQDRTVDPQKLIDDAISHYTTKGSVINAYGSGQIDRDTAQAVQDHLKNTYDNADDDTKAAMRKAEQDYQNQDQKNKQQAEPDKTQDGIIPHNRIGRIELPTGVTPQNQAEWEALYEAGQYQQHKPYAPSVPWTAENIDKIPSASVPGGLREAVDTAQIAGGALQANKSALDELQNQADKLQANPLERLKASEAYLSGYQNVPIADAMRILNNRLDAGQLSDDDYIKARDQLVQAYRLQNQYSGLVGQGEQGGIPNQGPELAGQPPSTGLQLQNQLTDLVKKAMGDDFFSAQREQARIDVGKAGKDVLADIKKGAAGFGSAWVHATGETSETGGPEEGDEFNQPYDPYGARVNPLDRTRDQDDNALDKARNDYNDAVSRTIVSPKHFAPFSQEYLAQRQQAPSQEVQEAGGEQVKEAAATAALALPLPGEGLLFEGLQKAIGGPLAKVLEFAGERSSAQGAKIFSKPTALNTLKRLIPGTTIGGTLTGQELYNHWQRLMDPKTAGDEAKNLAFDFLVPTVSGGLLSTIYSKGFGGGLGLTGEVSKGLADIIRASNDEAYVPIRAGKSVATGVGEKEGILRAPEEKPTIPYRAGIAGAVTSPLYRSVVQVGGRTLESYLKGAIKGVPYATITSQGDVNTFLQNVNQVGYMNALIHAPPNIMNAIRGTAFDPFYISKGEDPNKKPPWGLNTYGDARYAKPMTTSFNNLSPSAQNEWLYRQGFSDPYAKSYLLPDDLVDEANKSLTGNKIESPAGFMYTDKATGEKSVFVKESQFGKLRGHETGHLQMSSLSPTDQQRFIYATKQARDIDGFVNNYTHQVDSTLGDRQVSYNDLPTQAEVTRGNTQFDQKKADFANRVGLTRETAGQELAADTLGQLFSGQTGANWTKDPSLLRQFSMTLGSTMERLGFPTTTSDVNGPIGVPKGIIAAKAADSFLRNWAKGSYAETGVAPEGAIKLPDWMEQQFQRERGGGPPSKLPTLKDIDLSKTSPPPPPGPITEEEIRQRAFKLQQDRNLTGEAGTPETDWAKAQAQLQKERELLAGGPPAAPGGPKTPAGGRKAIAVPPVQPSVQPRKPPQPIPPGLVPPGGHAPDSPQAHVAADVLKDLGYTPGEAQAISEGRTPVSGPTNEKLMMPKGGQEDQITKGGQVITPPPVQQEHPARTERQEQTQVQSQPQEHESPHSGEKLVGVVGSEFGEVDNPQRGGYTEPGWDKGAWGDSLAGENNEGVALPVSILRHLGYTGQAGYGHLFNGNYVVRIHNPKTGAVTEAPLKDIGPGASTGALIDMLWGTRKKLGFDTNFKGAVNFEIVDKKTGDTVYAPTGHEVAEGGGGPIAQHRGGVGAETTTTPLAGAGGGPEAAAYAGPGSLAYESQQQPRPAPGMSQADLDSFRAEVERAPAPSYGGGGGGYPPPAVQDISAESMPYMYGPGAAAGFPRTATAGGVPIGAPEAPGAYMPAAYMPAGGGRGPKQLGGKYGAPEEEILPLGSTVNNGPVANEAVAPHLAKGTLQGLKDAQSEHAKKLTDDDMRVQKMPDGYFKGEYFQKGDQLHQHMLANTPANEKAVMNQAENAIASRQPMHVTYASAPRTGLGVEAPTTKSRQIEYEMSSPQARLLGKAKAQLAGHTFIPTAVGIKMAGKQGEPHQGYIQGVSMNAAANNHWHLNKAIAEAGAETPYPTLDHKFTNDLEGYISNLNAGYRGTGSSRQPGTKDYPVKVDRNHVAYRLKPEEAEYMNVLINNQAARAKKAGALRELAQKGGTLYTPEGETNPLRHVLDLREAKIREQEAAAHPESPELQERLKKRWSEDTLEPTIKTFKAGLVHQLHGTPEEMPEAIRPGEEFKGLAKVMQRHLPAGRPDVPISVAFMPMAGRKATGFQKAKETGRVFETPIPGPEEKPQERFEIPDQALKLKPAPKGSPHDTMLEHQYHKTWGEPMPLHEAIDHPELFENYPQLRQTKITMDRNMRAEGYYEHPYSTDAGEAAGDEIHIKEPEDRGTMVHEIQHAIQHIEDFPRGTSREEMYEKLHGIDSPVLEGVRKAAAEQHPMLNRQEWLAKEITEGGWKNPPSKSWANANYKDYVAAVNRSRGAWTDQRMRQIGAALYMRTPGEIEARTAGRRATSEAFAKETPQAALAIEHEMAQMRYPHPREMGENQPPYMEPSFMPSTRALSKKTQKKLGPVPEDPKQAELYQRVGERLDSQIPGAIPLEPAYDDKGNFRYDKTKDAPIYKTKEYDIANAPLLQKQGKALGYVTNEKTGKQSMAKAPKDTVDDLAKLDPEKRLIPYLNPTDRLRVSHLNKVSAVDTYANELVKFYRGIEHLPEVMGGKEWYDEAEGLLDTHFGSHKNLFANLLGATSAGNKVKINYNMALEAYHQFLRGSYDKAIDLYRQAYGIKKGGKGALMKHIIDNEIHTALGQDAPKTDEAAMAQWIQHHDIVPRSGGGKLFGHNSLAVLKVLAHTWEEEAGGPKTPNFAGNLSGRSLQATIDMWAARTMRRLGYEGHTKEPWLIQPAGETGVNDVDFGLSQLAFSKAAKQLGLKPRSLQAILWFAEQKHWQAQGWEREQDPAERDYRPMLKGYQRPSDLPETKYHPSEAEVVRRQ